MPEGWFAHLLVDASVLPDGGAATGEGRRAGAVAHDESGSRVYANDGRGTDLAPEQAGIERSRVLPHDAVGTDHGSLGVFQQQWPW